MRGVWLWRRPSRQKRAQCALSRLVDATVAVQSTLDDIPDLECAIEQARAASVTATHIKTAQWHLDNAFIERERRHVALQQLDEAASAFPPTLLRKPAAEKYADQKACDDSDNISSTQHLLDRSKNDALGRLVDATTAVQFTLGDIPDLERAIEQASAAGVAGTHINTAQSHLNDALVERERRRVALQQLEEAAAAAPTVLNISALQQAVDDARSADTADGKVSLDPLVLRTYSDARVLLTTYYFLLPASYLLLTRSAWILLFCISSSRLPVPN